MTKKPLDPTERALLSAYERYRSDLKAYFAGKWNMRHASPEDLVQKVYERLMAEDLSTIEDPRAFVFYLAAFVARSEIPARDKERITVTYGTGPAGWPESFHTESNALHVQAEYAQLHQFIDELEPHLTLVVRLHRLYGLTMPEISTITGIKPDVLNNRYRKALVTLRKRFGVSVLKNR